MVGIASAMRHLKSDLFHARTIIVTQHEVFRHMGI
jgi:hypothetical protein